MNFDNYHILNRFDKHNQATRYFGKLKIERSRTITNDKSWSVNGLKYWNDLKLDNFALSSYSAFKKTIKIQVIISAANQT